MGRGGGAFVNCVELYELSCSETKGEAERHEIPERSKAADAREAGA